MTSVTDRNVEYRVTLSVQYCHTTKETVCLTLSLPPLTPPRSSSASAPPAPCVLYAPQLNDLVSVQSSGAPAATFAKIPLQLSAVATKKQKFHGMISNLSQLTTPPPQPYSNHASTTTT